MPSVINRDTLIPVASVVVVLAAGISYGVMTQKVDMLQVQQEAIISDMRGVRDAQARTSEQVAAMNAQLLLVLKALDIPTGYSYAK